NTVTYVTLLLDCLVSAEQHLWAPHSACGPGDQGFCRLTGTRRVWEILGRKKVIVRRGITSLGAGIARISLILLPISSILHTNLPKRIFFRRILKCATEGPLRPWPNGLT